MRQNRIVFAVTIVLFTGIFSAVAQTNFNQPETRITVPEPTLQFGTDEDKWIPLFVQGLITTNLQNYSDMTVIDRANIDKLKKEQALSENAAYSEADQLKIGKLVAAKYVVSVQIIKKGTEYSFDCKVSDAETGTSIGKGYTCPVCTEEMLSNGSIVNEASRQLLLGLGVPETKMTALIKSAAGRPTQDDAIAAQTSLSKGIVAERSGMNLEAMTYYIQATGGDKQLKEAAQRLSSMSTSISRGNFGKEAENKISMRKKWVELLKQATANAEKNPPLIYVYSPNIKPRELTEKNYQNETMSFDFSGVLHFTDDYQVIASLQNALMQIPEAENWGPEVTHFPSSLASTGSWIPPWEAGSDTYRTVYITLSLRNEGRKILKTITQLYSIIQIGDAMDIYCIYSDGFTDVPVKDISSTDTLCISVDSIRLVTTYPYSKGKIDSDKPGTELPVSVATEESFADQLPEFEKISVPYVCQPLYRARILYWQAKLMKCFLQKTITNKYEKDGYPRYSGFFVDSTDLFAVCSGVVIDGKSYISPFARSRHTDGFQFYYPEGIPCLSGMILSSKTVRPERNGDTNLFQYSSNGTVAFGSTSYLYEIDEIDTWGPAYKAGLRKGDIIVNELIGRDGKAVLPGEETDLAQFLKPIENFPYMDQGNTRPACFFSPGDIVTFKVIQKNKDEIEEIPVTLVSTEEYEANREKESLRKKTEGYSGLNFYLGAILAGKIKAVDAGSPAEKAGIQAGDKITGFSSDLYPDGSDTYLYNFEGLHPGDEIILTLKKKGKVRVVLGWPKDSPYYGEE
jgi:hypothetical protein